MTQEREAFEAAYSAAYPWTVENTPDCFEQTASGNYEITGVMVGWRMWQARASLAQPASVPAGRSQLTAVDAATLSGLMHDAAIRYADGYTVDFDAEASDFLVGAAPQPAQSVPMKGTLNLSDPAVQKRLAAQWGYVQAPAPAQPKETPAGDLLPCPFCGGDVDIACVELMSSRDGGPVYVHCDVCGADGPQHDWADDAKADWNRRTQAPAVDAAPQPEAQPRLTVRLCSFPESNGKRNWTALLVRAEKWGGLVGNCGGISVARGEYWNRVAYEAECAKLLIGERDTEPSILDYGDDIQTPEEWAGEKRGGRRVAAPSAQADPATCPHTGQCHPGFCPCISRADTKAEQKGGE